MDDLTTYVLLATSFFFVALAFALLIRYRQISQRINASTDLGHDLWSSLEQRLRKQDERILDVMGRLEVIQGRVMAAAAAPAVLSPLPHLQDAPVPSERKLDETSELQSVTQQPESEPQELTPPKGVVELDETQMAALKLLGESPKDTRQVTDALKKSREHTARMMKELFEMGLVTRNNSTKPFVYQLTEEGRRRLA
jgi:DNA-binding MarR family transcriptional regulator